MWRNRIATIAGSSSFALIGVSGGFYADDAGGRVFAVVLLALSLALALRASVSLCVEFSDNSLVVKSSFRTITHGMAEVAELGGERRWVVGRQRRILTVRTRNGHIRRFPDLSERLNGEDRNGFVSRCELEFAARSVG